MTRFERACVINRGTSPPAGAISHYTKYPALDILFYCTSSKADPEICWA